MKKIKLLIALLVMALPTIAQMKLEVTNQNDTVLCMEEISDSSWTVTLPNEKVEDRLLFLLTAAIVTKQDEKLQLIFFRLTTINI